MSILNRASTEPTLEDTSAGLPVPEALQPYWDRTTGLTPTERARLTPDGGVKVYDTTYRVVGPRDELCEPEILTVDEYEHQLRLEQADQLRRADEAAALMPQPTVCALCGEEAWPGLYCTIDVGDAQVPVHAGRCAETVQAEQHRRRYAQQLDALLG